jgi:hypothetical protein
LSISSRNSFHLRICPSVDVIVFCLLSEQWPVVRCSLHV